MDLCLQFLLDARHVSRGGLLQLRPPLLCRRAWHVELLVRFTDRLGRGGHARGNLLLLLPLFAAHLPLGEARLLRF